MKNTDPRRWALTAVDTLEKRRYTLDRILEEIQEKNPGLSRRDHHLFHALAYGVIRWQKRLDWYIRRFSKTPMSKIDPSVRNIQRIALFQILFMDKIPVSAAINTSVELTKTVAPPWVVRYVNGVLRNAARAHRAVRFPSVDEDPVKAIAVTRSYPEWLIEKWIDRFGIQTCEAICDAGNRIAPLTLRVNRLRTTKERLARSLVREAKNVSFTPYAPDGVSLSGLKTAIFEMSAFREGLFQVQDEAAQLVTLYMNPKPDETVLDACAGLGGKTGHIVQMMGGTGRVVALDHRRHKLDRLESEMRRLGFATVTPCQGDLTLPNLKLPHPSYDRILLDAPCSGIGVIRRNPDTKWRLGKGAPTENAKRQKQFLAHLAHLVKPSGILVYAVCSTEPEENEAVVKEFLNNHPEFGIDNPGSGFPATAGGILNKQGFMKTTPHEHQMDGFFAARLRRRP